MKLNKSKIAVEIIKWANIGEWVGVYPHPTLPLQPFKSGKWDSYDFYYMKDYIKRANDLAEYVVNGN
jgi:hypothetical protein